MSNKGGRKGLPSNVHELKGNPGKRKKSAAEPQPKVKAQPYPDYMRDHEIACGIWDRLNPELERWGLITILYVDALAAYCLSVEKFIVAETALAEKAGLTYETHGRQGKMRRAHPEIAIINEALRNVRSFGSEFGLSPVSMRQLTGAAQGNLFDEPLAKALSGGKPA